MAKHKKNELRHNWRSIYFKILKNLQKKNCILSFEILNSIDVNEIHCFKIKTKENIFIKLNFFKSIYFEKKVHLAEERFDKLSLIVGEHSKPKELTSLLKNYLQQMASKKTFGKIIEEIFEERIKMVRSNEDINDILKTDSKNLLDEHNGIDFFIRYRKIQVPLQIKSSKSAQDEHRRKYPNIPSFVFIPEHYTNKLLKIFTIKICDAYLQGRALHI